jgi:hypothetical protein
VIRALRLAALGLVTLTAAVAAQTPPFEPQLIFSIGAGLAAGGGELWSLPQQGVRVVGGPTGNEIDTLGLARWLVPGPAATLAATYHRSPHWGLTAEGGYFAVESEQRCSPPAAGYTPDSENKNEQACTRGNGTQRSTSIVGFQVGLAYRGSLSARIMPYARASAGIGFLADSYVRTDGAIQAPLACNTSTGVCQWPLIEAERTAETTWIASLAVGAALDIGTGYRFRFEARDLIASLQVPASPANPATGFAPVGSTVRHIPVFTAGIDVILERRRGRRY